MRRLLLAIVLLVSGTLSCFSQTSVLPSYRNATGSGSTEVSAANPLPIIGTVGPSSLASAGAQQSNVAVTTNTTLTVPAGAKSALITFEGGNVRRTSDGTSASATVGSLFYAGGQYSDSGPLASYKYTAVDGTQNPTITVEYFK